MTKVAVVTRANKGLGFAIAEGLAKKFDGVVYLTSRNEARGNYAVENLISLGLQPKYHQLDPNHRESIIEFRKYIVQKYGGIDILINKAGVTVDTLEMSDYEDAKHIADTHFFSVLLLEELLYPIVRNNGRILNITSDIGQTCQLTNEYWKRRIKSGDLVKSEISDFINWYLEGRRNNTLKPHDVAAERTEASYAVTKVALIALNKLQQRDLESRNISINCTHSGSDMIKSGDCDIDTVADAHVFLVLGAPANHKGNFVL